MKKPKDFEFITEPYDFQLEAFAVGIEKPNAGLLLDMGLGKSKIAIDIARYRIQHNGINRIWVVVPATILYNWLLQIQLHSEYSALVLAAGTKKKRMDNVMNSNYYFNIINYEALCPLLIDLNVFVKVETKKGNFALYYGPTAIETLKSIMPQLIIFDESARYLSSHDADRTISAITIADMAKFKLILTGTPIRNKPIGIWPQFRVLDGGKTFSDNFYKFRHFFFEEKEIGAFKTLSLLQSKIPILQKGIYKLCVRMTKEEVLDSLPKKVFHTITVEMPPALAKIYYSVRKHIYTEIQGKSGTTVLWAQNILTRLLRLQQITGGFTVDTKTGKPIILNQTPKLDALIEEVQLIIEAEEAAVIWTRFLYSIDLIAARFQSIGIPYITMSGNDTNKKERFEKWKKYQTDKSIPIFIGQIESGGIGIELFKLDGDKNKAQHMLFYENTYVLDTRLQAIDRIHRIGQLSMCRYVDFIVKNTIDQRIIDIFNENKNVADAIMEAGGINKFLKEAT